MSYTPGAITLWPLTPDWNDEVTEKLVWLTDVIRSRNGRAQKRELRRSPRREFEFTVVANDQRRRVLDNLLQANSGDYWQLPMFPDVQQLSAGVASGESFIPCRTTGFDFVEGGKVLLQVDLMQWELLTIDTISDTGLALTSTITQDFSAGCSVYPVRLAFLDDQPEETVWTDRAGTRSVTFRVEPPNDWPAIAPTATYRGYPVLEWRPEWSESPKRVFSRTLETVDADTGPIAVFDFPGRSFPLIKQRWIAHGREENTDLRSLLYFFRGRMATVWVPTWQSDFLLVSSMTSLTKNMTVEFSGYSLFDIPAQYRDIRIELNDGQVFYRRITSVTNQAITELLVLDTALGVAVSPSQVRTVSFMVLSEQTSDTVELHHTTDADGLTELSIGFQGVRHDI